MSFRVPEHQRASISSEKFPCLRLMYCRPAPIQQRFSVGAERFSHPHSRTQRSDAHGSESLAELCSIK
eukprot:s2195_g17.t1